MRRGQDAGLYKNKDGHPFGINLGADFTAEHEMGIRELHEVFGINSKLIGVEGRRIEKIPLDEKEHEDFLFFRTTKDEMVLAYSSPKRVDYEKKQELHVWKDYETGKMKELACAWSSGDFAIRAVNPNIELSDFLKSLWKAFKEKDVAFGLGKPMGYESNPFANYGLFLMIVPRIPEEILSALKEKDLEWKELKDAEKKSGLIEYLTTKGKSWFYLGAKTWRKEPNGARTLLWWLNPMNQDQYNAGYFDDIELRMWADEKGPIVKSWSKPRKK